MTLYSFGALTNRRGESPGFFRRPLDDRTVRAIYPDGFLPVIRGKIWDGSAVVGGRGTLGGFDVDLSQSYGTNAFNFNVANSANITYGASSPTTFDAGTLEFQQGATNLDLTRTLRLPNAAPLRVAGGAEFRAENYRLAPGEPASYSNGGVAILNGPDSGRAGAIGSQVFPGYQPSDRTNASRTSEALYADFESDLTRQFLLGLAAGFPNISGAQFFINAVGTRTRGIDAVGNYGLTYGGGLARCTAGYSRTQTRVVDVIPTPAVLQGQSETLFGRVERARLENAQPRSNLLLSASYDRGPLGLVLRTQRFGSVTSTNSPGFESLDQTFSPKWVSDVSVSYRFVPRATLTAGSDNVFNVYPDRFNNNSSVAAGNSSNAYYGIIPYSTFSPFGFNGRLVYARVTVGL